MATKCSSFRCFNCEALGHRIEDCQSPPLFSTCLKVEDHDVSVCPFLVYSAKVVNQSRLPNVDCFRAFSARDTVYDVF